MPELSPTSISAAPADPPAWLAVARTLAEVAVVGLALATHHANARAAPADRLAPTQVTGDGARTTMAPAPAASGPGIRGATR